MIKLKTAVIFPVFILWSYGILQAQIVLQYKKYGTEYIQNGRQNDENASYEKTNLSYRFRAPYPVSDNSDFYALFELIRDDKKTDAKNITSEPLRTGSTLNADNFPSFLRNDLYHLGVGYRAIPEHKFFYGVMLNQNTANSKPDNSANFWTHILVYDYYYVKKSYFRLIAATVQNTSYQAFYVAPAYYYEGELFRIRVTPIYLRSYYDLDDKWQVNLKLNDESRYYRLNKKDFNNGLLKYAAREISTGIQYRVFDLFLINVDIGYQAYSEIKFLPEHQKDFRTVGDNTYGLSPAPYISVYFTAGPRNHPE